MITKTQTSFLTIAIVIIALFAYFKLTPDKWVGFYYPNRADLTRYTQSPQLGSIEECRSWVNAQVPAGINSYDYDYECGKNCKFRSDLDINVCEETLR